MNPAPIRIVSGSALTRLDRPLAISWVVVTTIGLIIIAFSAIRLARPRQRWSKATVDGVPVLVSHDLGPAVIGVLRYRIVLPAWALELAPVERDLILAHEREHASAGDPFLLLLATVLLAMMPWNAPLWWMARRLRFAIELDCDARVLRRRPDPSAYGSLLLDVSERTIGGAMPIAALAEPVSLIERRIAAMTSHLPRFAPARALAAGTIAAALVVVACATPHPTTAPAPITDVQSAAHADSIRLAAAQDSIASLLRSLDSLRRGHEIDPDLRAALDRAIRAVRRDSGQRLSALPNLDTAAFAQLRARLDSMQRLLSESSARSERLLRTPADGASEPLFIVDGVVMSGASVRDLDSLSIQSVEVVKGSAAVAQFGAKAANGIVTIKTNGRRSRSSASDSITSERALAIASRYFPQAFTGQENEHDLIVLVFDSTGALIKSGRSTRPPRAPGESITGRDVLKAVFPGTSIESFSRWGMTQSSTTMRQIEISGVTVVYAFTGRSPR